MSVFRKKIGFPKSIWIALMLTILPSCFSGVASASDAPFLDVTAGEVVNEIKIGWNVGNSLDSYHKDYESSRPNNLSLETLWYNPKITKDLIDYVAAQGFNAVRIPVTWYYNTDPTSLAINRDWLARVKEVVDYAMENNMYVVINSHHDDNLFYTGVTEEEMAGVLSNAETLWTDIAAYFKDYNERLIFEAFNEIDNKAASFQYSETAAKQMNQLNQVFVDAVRETGGNNAKRILMVPTLLDGYQSAMLNAFEVPEDPCPDKLIVQVHCYSQKYGEDIEAEFTELENFSKAWNTPVIIGEFGTVKGHPISGHRAQIAKNYVARAASHGMKCFWWDNGSDYAVIDRSDFSQSDSEMIQALMDGVGGNANVLTHTEVFGSRDQFELGLPVIDQTSTDFGKITYSSWDGLTCKAINVTPGEYRNVSLTSSGDVYDVFFHSLVFYDSDGQALSAVDLRASGNWTKYTYGQVPEGAATMRVCIYSPYTREPAYNLAFQENRLELRVSSFEVEDVLIPAAPFQYDRTVSVAYQVTAGGENLGETVKYGASNDMTFDISSKYSIQDGLLLCAVYHDGGEMVSVSHKNASLAKGDNTITLCVDIPQADGLTVKVFLWKQANLEPLYTTIIPQQTEG